MLLLEQNIIRRKQVNEFPEIEPELNVGKDKKYKVEAIKDSAVHTNKTIRGQLPELYYPISWKYYLEDENTYKSISAVMHL